MVRRKQCQKCLDLRLTGKIQRLDRVGHRSLLPGAVQLGEADPRGVEVQSHGIGDDADAVRSFGSTLDSLDRLQMGQRTIPFPSPGVNLGKAFADPGFHRPLAAQQGIIRKGQGIGQAARLGHIDRDMGQRVGAVGKAPRKGLCCLRSFGAKDAGQRRLADAGGKVGVGHLPQEAEGSVDLSDCDQPLCRTKCEILPIAPICRADLRLDPGKVAVKAKLVAPVFCFLLGVDLAVVDFVHQLAQGSHGSRRAGKIGHIGKVTGNFHGEEREAQLPPGLLRVRLPRAYRGRKEVERAGPVVAVRRFLHDRRHHDAGHHGTVFGFREGLLQRHLEDALLGGDGNAGGIGQRGGGGQKKQGKGTHGTAFPNWICGPFWRGKPAEMWKRPRISGRPYAPGRPGRSEESVFQ